MGTGTINSKRRYLESLKSKHRHLDASITKQFNDYSASDVKIKQLKLEKLTLKNKITALENELHNA